MTIRNETMRDGMGIALTEPMLASRANFTALSGVAFWFTFVDLATTGGGAKGIDRSRPDADCCVAMDQVPARAENLRIDELPFVKSSPL